MKKCRRKFFPHLTLPVIPPCSYLVVQDGIMTVKKEIALWPWHVKPGIKDRNFRRVLFPNSEHNQLSRLRAYSGSRSGLGTLHDRFGIKTLAMSSIFETWIPMRTTNQFFTREYIDYPIFPFTARFADLNPLTENHNTEGEIPFQAGM